MIALVETVRLKKSRLKQYQQNNLFKTNKKLFKLYK